MMKTKWMGKTVLLSALSLAMVLAPGCGRPDNANPRDRSSSASSMIPVAGSIRLGTQCDDGTFSPPHDERVELWDCPIQLQMLEFAQPPRGLSFKADCKDMTLTIRSDDRALDEKYNVMPDGTFSLELDQGGPVTLRNDGAGNRDCTSYMKLDLSGRIVCPANDTQRDKAVVDLETVWWFGQGARPSRSSGSVNECRIPNGCFLYSAAKLRQCI
jgi:hypothetical protein